MVLCTEKELRLSVLNTHTHTQGRKQTLECLWCAYYLDCGEGTTGVCICPNSSSCTHLSVHYLCIKSQ